MCVCVCAHVHTCSCCTYRGHLEGVSSVLPSCKFWGLTLGHRPESTCYPAGLIVTCSVITHKPLPWELSNWFPIVYSHTLPWGFKPQTTLEAGWTAGRSELTLCTFPFFSPLLTSWFPKGTAHDVACQLMTLEAQVKSSDRCFQGSSRPQSYLLETETLQPTSTANTCEIVP